MNPVTFLRETCFDEVLWPLLSHDDRQFGFVDCTGSWVCKPCFDDAHRFERGRAPVKLSDKWGLIDYQGNWLTAPKFDWINHEGPGPARARAGMKTGFLDEENGMWLVQPDFDYASSFSCGLCHIILGAKADEARHGYMDKSGKIVIAPVLRKAGDFREDRALACLPERPSKFGYIDKSGPDSSETGVMTIAPQFESGVNFSEGLAGVRFDSKWGCIDRYGEWVISPLFETALFFRNGMSRTHKGGTIGFVNTQGEWLCTVDGVDEIWDCCHGVFPAAVCGASGDNNWGYMNLSSDWIVKPQFMVTKPLHRGLGEVRTHDGKTGFLNRDGGWIVEANFDDAYIDEDLIRVFFGERQGYLDLSGNALTFDEREVH